MLLRVFGFDLNAAVPEKFDSRRVQRDQWDTYWGRKRKFFNSRRQCRPWSMAAAPVESCQSLSKRCPWGRLGPVLYTCKRLRRIRRRFDHFWSNSLNCPRRFSRFSRGLLPGLSESTRPPHRRRMRYRRRPTTRPTPRDRQEPICPRKKCAIWARWRPLKRLDVCFGVARAFFLHRAITRGGERP